MQALLILGVSGLLLFAIAVLLQLHREIKNQARLNGVWAGYSYCQSHAETKGLDIYVAAAMRRGMPRRRARAIAHQLRLEGGKRKDRNT